MKTFMTSSYDVPEIHQSNQRRNIKATREDPAGRGSPGPMLEIDGVSNPYVSVGNCNPGGNGQTSKVWIHKSLLIRLPLLDQAIAGNLYVGDDLCQALPW